MNDSVGPNMEAIQEKVVELVGEICGNRAKLDDSLALLGIDSVSMAELTIEMEKKFGIRINDDIMDVETISGLEEARYHDDVYVGNLHL